MKDTPDKPSRIFNLSNTEPFESLALVRARRFAQGTQRNRRISSGGTELASLVLRRIAAEGARVSLLHELVQIGALEPLDWSELGDQLAAAIRAIGKDVREGGIFAAVSAFQMSVPAAAWERAASAALGNPAAYLPLCEDEELQLARGAIELVEREVARFRTAAPADDREECIALASTLPLHLWIAAEAVRRVRDRRRRAALTADVERVASCMTYFAQFVRMEPAVPWHPSFTTAFDAENVLRFAMGLTAVDRM